MNFSHSSTKVRASLRSSSRRQEALTPSTSRPVRAWLGALALCILAFAFIPIPRNLSAQTVEVSANVGRLTVLLKLIRATDWPAESFPSPTAPYILGVLGNDQFGALLDEVTKKPIRNNRYIVVKHYANPEDARDCHLLYISASEDDHLKSIIQSLGDARVLTVGESDQFTKVGGFVSLVIEKKVSFKVSRRALKNLEKLGLKVDSECLGQGAPVN